MWDEIGDLQFRFLLGEGLRPADVLVDVGCGALRGGVRFVPYLDRGHYLGIDKEASLIRAGRRELGRQLLRKKSPEFVVSDRFEFSRFSRKGTIAIAQSVFSHLNEHDIKLCLERLRPAVEKDAHFYVTFFASGFDESVSAASHSHRMFSYAPEQLGEIGDAAGWDGFYVGEIGHPRGQVVMRFTSRGC